jgi:AmmeMemoRadiSam system protein B
MATTLSKNLVKLLSLIAIGAVLVVVNSQRLSPSPASQNSIQNPDIKTHQAYFTTPDFYENAFKNSGKAPNISAYALLVNHHLLASELLAQGFNAIATEKAVTVVVISPDHFSHGASSITSSDLAWTTPYGKLPVNIQALEKLVSSGLVSLDSTAMDSEHGIANLVGFFKKALPEAKIIPLLVRPELKVKKALEYAEQLSALLPPDSIVVGSFDFSHYLPSPVADFHDQLSLDTVESFNYENLDKLDVDSQPGLAVFLKLLELRKLQNFHLLGQSNSAKLLANPDQLETTSYLVGYFAKGAPIKTANIQSLLALGNLDTQNPNTPKAFDRRGNIFAYKYLERLFFGQNTTAIFTPQNNSGMQAILDAYKIHLPVENSVQVNLNPVSVLLNPKPECQASLNPSIPALPIKRIILCDSEKIALEQQSDTIIFQGLGRLDPLTDPKKPKDSLAVGVLTKDTTLEINLFPIRCYSHECKLLVGTESAIVLKNIADISLVSLKLRKEISSGKILLNIR